MFEKLKWRLKQLFPLTYYTEYGENGKWYFVIWKMWMGRSYEITKFEIKKNR
jgi:hypothetical protein